MVLLAKALHLEAWTSNQKECFLGLRLRILKSGHQGGINNIYRPISDIYFNLKYPDFHIPSKTPTPSDIEKAKFLMIELGPVWPGEQV